MFEFLSGTAANITREKVPRYLAQFFSLSFGSLTHTGEVNAKESHEQDRMTLMTNNLSLRIGCWGFSHQEAECNLSLLYLLSVS